MRSAPAMPAIPAGRMGDAPGAGKRQSGYDRGDFTWRRSPEGWSLHPRPLLDRWEEAEIGAALLRVALVEHSHLGRSPVVSRITFENKNSRRPYAPATGIATEPTAIHCNIPR
jgi:hypothetical protein